MAWFSKSPAAPCCRGGLLHSDVRNRARRVSLEDDESSHVCPTVFDIYIYNPSFQRCFFHYVPLHVRARTQESTRVKVSGFTLKHGLSPSNMVVHGNFTATHADFTRGRVKSAGHRTHKHGRSEERCLSRTNTVVAKTVLNTVVE